MKAVTVSQKTAYTVTDIDDGIYADAEGHIYFTKDIAREIARELRTMYAPANGRTIKMVVTVRSTD
jgi:hypothetical protein